MNKLQIQLPEPLYRKLKHLAKKLDFSMAELLRRGAEHIVIHYPQHFGDEAETGWKLPKGRDLGAMVSDPVKLRQLANERE